MSSALCVYAAQDRFGHGCHRVHLGGRASGGVALVVVEATAVTAEGRISPADMGIWKDEHIEPLARIARFVETQGAVPGIQLAHAGRKASCDKPWTGARSLKTAAEGGWPVIGPSPLPFAAGDPVPVPLTEEDIDSFHDPSAPAQRRASGRGCNAVAQHTAQHLRHRERRERGRWVEYLLDLEPDAGESLGDLLHLCRRVEMLLEPAKREFHRWSLPLVGTSVLWTDRAA